MPNLRDIKRRITSIENTQKITSAMKMVSAAKLRRAQGAVESARPYARNMRDTLQEVVRGQTDAENALLEPRAEVRCVGLVVICSDRGLAGAFNNQVLKAASALIEQRKKQGQKISLTLLGKRAGDFFRRRDPDQIELAEPTGPRITYPQAARIARGLVRGFEEGELDEVIVIFNEFVTTMTQRPKTLAVLPIVASEEGEGSVPGAGGGEAVAAEPYEIEPSAKKLLATLAPKAVEVEIFQALLENQAGEHAARMTAMESATKNTEELIDKLTLDFNRARQAAITRELVEIVTGAQALD